MKGSFGTQIKEILRKRDITIKALADMIEEKTGTKMSRQNLTQRLTRDNFQEQDMQMIAEVLGCTVSVIVDEGDYKYDSDALTEETADALLENTSVQETAVLSEKASVPEATVLSEKASVPEATVLSANTSVPESAPVSEEPAVTSAYSEKPETETVAASVSFEKTPVSGASPVKAEPVITPAVTEATEQREAAASVSFEKTPISGASPVKAEPVITPAVTESAELGTAAAAVSHEQESTAARIYGRTAGKSEPAENIYNSSATLEELLQRAGAGTSRVDDPIPAFTVRSSSGTTSGSSSRLNELTEEARARAAKAREERLQMARRLREEEDKKRSEKEEEERARIKEIARRAVAATRSTKSSFVRDENVNSETGTVNSRSMNMQNDSVADHSGYSGNTYSEMRTDPDYGYRKTPESSENYKYSGSSELSSGYGYGSSQDMYSDNTVRKENEGLSGYGYGSYEASYSNQGTRKEGEGLSGFGYYGKPIVLPERNYDNKPENYQAESSRDNEKQFENNREADYRNYVEQPADYSGNNYGNYTEQTGKYQGYGEQHATYSEAEYQDYNRRPSGYSGNSYENYAEQPGKYQGYNEQQADYSETEYQDYNRQPSDYSGNSYENYAEQPGKYQGYNEQPGKYQGYGEQQVNYSETEYQDYNRQPSGYSGNSYENYAEQPGKYQGYGEQQANYSETEYQDYNRQPSGYSGNSYENYAEQSENYQNRREQQVKSSEEKYRNEHEASTEMTGERGSETAPAREMPVLPERKAAKTSDSSRKEGRFRSEENKTRTLASLFKREPKEASVKEQESRVDVSSSHKQEKDDLNQNLLKKNSEYRPKNSKPEEAILKDNKFTDGGSTVTDHADDLQEQKPVSDRRNAAEEPETLVQAARRSGEAGAAMRNTAEMGVVPDVFRRVAKNAIQGPDINPRTGAEYDSNVVRNHPTLKGYIQVYDKGDHKWIDMTEWAFLGFQEKKKAMLGSEYKPPIYLD